eukprot:CAMPEP_0181204218 /NCGR_PEP_ID=MMETSP1096-20121128/19814_1 /TAXON_ID=156174 ORGANISM="Chrysochromulina ericina, Strain CCMP281" /NCGR_SAMPLE_ID=MMETSP1096 /ASSEMBLY_ACC=CAM_ASM_000453 /LENGTH=145 /DNA_ID=CAMNT_0023294895 /DNA_START=289 /DNA_END=727 /DNA_ORIENTATION=-
MGKQNAKQPGPHTASRPSEPPHMPIALLTRSPSVGHLDAAILTGHLDETVSLILRASGRGRLCGGEDELQKQLQQAQGETGHVWTPHEDVLGSEEAICAPQGAVYTLRNGHRGVDGRRILGKDDILDRRERAGGEDDEEDGGVQP